jgi:hypothetical protein
MVLDDRILDGPLRDVTGEHHVAAPDVELRRVRGVGHLDPPVLGAGGGAAQVQPPLAVRQPDEFRALKRFGGQLFLGDQRQRLEVHAVAREGERHGVPPAAADRTAQPVGQVDAFVGQDRRRAAGPVPSTRARRGDRYHRVAWPGEKRVFIATNHVGIIDKVATGCSRTRRFATRNWMTTS